MIAVFFSVCPHVAKEGKSFCGGLLFFIAARLLQNANDICLRIAWPERLPSPVCICVRLALVAHKLPQEKEACEGGWLGSGDVCRHFSLSAVVTDAVNLADSRQCCSRRSGTSAVSARVDVCRG